MNFKIIADSACDLNEEIQRIFKISLVPLRLNLGDKHYIDDDQLDISTYLKALRESPSSPQSASPPPSDFMDTFHEGDNVYVVTLSSKISSTFNNAVIAKNMFIEQYSHKFIHVFDSFTASVGETLVAMKIFELAKTNIENNELVEKVNQYICGMKTYFLLDSLDNLIKSGRMNKLVGALATALSIKPILGASEGEIALVEKVRGSKKAFNRFVEIIGEKGDSLEDKILGIAHCNCLDKAISLKDEISKKYKFKEVIIVEMGPTIAGYADEGGLLVSF